MQPERHSGQRVDDGESEEIACDALHFQAPGFVSLRRRPKQAKRGPLLKRRGFVALTMFRANVAAQQAMCQHVGHLRTASARLGGHHCTWRRFGPTPRFARRKLVTAYASCFAISRSL